jgi:hypothetical protein
MLEHVEFVPSPRKTVRRAVDIGCEVVSRVDTRVERMIDLSPYGARVRCKSEVRRGQEILLTFVPPNAPRRVAALGTVRHQAEGIVGVEFFSLDRIDRSTLTQHLRGLPPPLPRARPVEHDLVWVDALLTWEEDLGDRVNIFEVSERISAVSEDEIEIASIGGLMTAGRPAYRWKS